VRPAKWSPSPAPISEGAVRSMWSLGVGQALEPCSAPHSSVAVRNQQRRDEARWPGQRGVPLAIRRGRHGGSAVGRLAHGLPPPTVGAASRPMCQLAWRSGCSVADRTITSSGGPAADVPPREPKASDWRGGRAAASASRTSVLSGPASGLAGDRGGDLTGAATSGAQRSDLQAGQFAKRASFTRSVKKSGTACPRARQRAAACLSRHRRPDRVA
jgi:hypothetical protein